jgi:V/A-type H+/Na+-transporting ATPase subunit K
MNKRFAFALIVLALLTFAAIAQSAAQGAPAGTPGASAASGAEVRTATPVAAWKYISAALAVGMACLGGGMAVGKLGAAAMGAIAEDPSLAGKAIPYLGLAEGICLWGFLVALLILML